MRRLFIPPLVALALLVSACGDDPGDTRLNDLPRTGAATCLADEQVGSSPVLLDADLDGDGQPEAVQLAAGSGDCRAILFARAGGKRPGVEVPGDLPVAPDRATGVQVPGRRGVLVLLRQTHPRGGFQARLFGYADGRLEELTVGDRPVLPFVATDVPSTPVSADCTTNGFEVTEARAHTPIGIVPAWDVYRTAYTIDGNTLTKEGTEEVADNVLDGELAKRYAALVHHRLFAGCRTGTE